MARLVYSAMMQLDGFIEEKAESSEWAEYDGEVRSLINAIEARHGTYLYRRSKYKVMVA
jgi:hypothetical protein